MNYPLISEYIESIMCAEDNFATLTNLRPVLDDGGSPIMSSGNFAVVFKMQDIETKKFYAIKCFIKSQNGREDNYKAISKDLKGVVSKHIVDFEYMENELFVQCRNDDYIDAPVVKMEWVDGMALDKFIEQNLNDPFRMKYLAYKFAVFTEWLKEMPFAHGDLKPDNILVKKDCTIVMIDYDGMFVPSLTKRESNEIGSPNYQHPSRTAKHFSKDIDDFSLLIIMIEILFSQVYDELKFPLFSEADYRNFTESPIIKRIFPSVNSALNLAMSALVNSLIEDKVAIPRELFISINGLVKQDYYDASNEEPNRIKNIDNEKKHYSWNFYTKGWRGEDDNYPVMPSACDDGFPCKIKDGSLLKAYDYDAGTYLGECWDEYWDSIVVPDDIVAIVDNAFMGCEFIKFVVLPNSIKSLGNNVFHGCNQLQYIVLPEKIERIGNHLLNLWPDSYLAVEGSEKTDLLEDFEKNFIGQFDSDFDLQNITLPEGLQKYSDILRIYNESCCKFKNFIVPNGCKEYYQNLISEYKDYIIDFSEFVNSESVGVNPLTISIANKVGMPSTKIIKYTKDEECCVIPSDVKTICTRAFAENERLKKVVIPETEIMFGADVFEYCKNLESIVLPSTMTSIPDGFLHGCEKLKELTLPSRLRSIGKNAFSNCKSLCRINIPDGVTVIGSSAFDGCKSLESISLPKVMDEIGENAFSGCSNLSSIVMPEKLLKLGYGVFKGCKSLVGIRVPIGLESIPSYCFHGCENLMNISLPTTITSISCEAFGDCKSLDILNLPLSLQKIDWGAFSDSGLSRIVFPKSVETISYSAFKNCSKLLSIEIPSDIRLRKIEKYTFEGCDSIEDLIIPDCIEEIEERAFSRCKSLKRIRIPSKITSIASGLFSGCVNLEYVNYLADITSIGQEAFYRCRSLKQITIPNQVTEIGHNSFCGVNINVIDIKSDYFERDRVAIYTKGKKSLVEVLMISPTWQIPDGVEEIRAWAFNGCKYTKLIIPISVKELCKDAFVSSVIDRIEIHQLLKVHHDTFCKEIKEIAVPRHLVDYYKKAITNNMGYSLYDIDKKIISL